jgi:hypothetical protein
MNMAITQETKIEGYDSMMDANAHLMSEVYNDAKLGAAEKLRCFSMGVRNQVLLSRDLSARRKELFGYGMKFGADIKALNFNPAETVAPAESVSPNDVAKESPAE